MKEKINLMNKEMNIFEIENSIFTNSILKYSHEMKTTQKNNNNFEDIFADDDII